MLVSRDGRKYRTQKKSNAYKKCPECQHQNYNHDGKPCWCGCERIWKETQDNA